MSYNLYTQFVNSHFDDEFINLKEEDKAISKLNQKNRQFLVASNLIALKHLYVSEYFTQMLGYENRVIDPQFFMSIIHPDDLKRYQRIRAKLLDAANDIYHKKEGQILVSANFKARRSNGEYIEVLYQCFLYYWCAQNSTNCNDYKDSNVVMNLVITDITRLIDNQKLIHTYIGNDITLFRYPDENLLQLGNVLTKRELEIICLIEEGNSSEVIANKLFLSTKTVNTHRSNILKKLNKSNVVEAIYELKRQGVI